MKRKRGREGAREREEEGKNRRRGGGGKGRGRKEGGEEKELLYKTTIRKLNNQDLNRRKYNTVI